jgi:DNA-binding winged helix-turn-helix (wHTH) protein
VHVIAIFVGYVSPSLDSAEVLANFLTALQIPHRMSHPFPRIETTISVPMKATSAPTAFFGPYALDPRSGELRKFGVRVKLGEQPLQILLLLLENQGEVVSREELRAKLWGGDTFVDFDHSLNSAVQRLRDCLSDTAEKPLWIETVPRRGYRFIGRFVRSAPANIGDWKI